MKKKIVALALLLALSCLSLFACIDGDRARATIHDFLEAVSADQYDRAETYIHPERPDGMVASFFAGVETATRVDFSAGVEILRYASVESSHYRSDVGGSQYTTTAVCRVGDKEVEMIFQIVENDAGYGIYYINIDDVT